jgi:tetratricopeptide (TPR) repeat protein
MSAVFEDPGQDVGAILAAVEQAAARALAEQERSRAPTPASRIPDPRATPLIRPPTPSAPILDMSPEEALRQRREALARKLTGGRRPSGVMQAVAAASAPRAPVVQMDPAHAERAEEAMRRRREAAVAEARKAQLTSHLDAGRAAIERGDYPAAVNAYRIAASLEPDDPAVQATCNEALRRAAAALADGYWKQALYEEGQDRWSEAALSYAKVCTGKPDNAQAHERVAYATLKSGGNARRAVEFARKAVEIDPRKPDFHVTLARAYAAAGLEKSARGELDRAVALAPKDQRVLGLVAQAKSALVPKDGK